MSQPPIFVVGYQHSGTTLVQNILGRHERVYKLPFETKFFEHGHMIRSRFPSLEDREEAREYVRFLKDIVQTGYRIHGRYALGGESWKAKLNLKQQNVEGLAQRLDLQEQAHVQAFRQLCDLVAASNSCTRWVEGTPSHVFFANEIGEALPDAQFVEIVRDARDILASKKTRSVTAKEDSKYDREGRRIRGLTFAFDPVLDAISWKAAIRAGEVGARNFTRRWYRIRYEDLVTDSWAIVQDLCRFLDLRPDEAMLRVSGRGGAERSKHRDSEGIRRDSVGRWRNVLRPHEGVAAQLVTGKDLSALGYDVEDAQLPELLLTPLVFIRSSLRVIDRLRRKLAVGGLKYAVNVLLNWWDRASHLFGRE